MKYKPGLFKSINDEQGMALVVVLLVIVVVSIMGLSMLGLAASNSKMSSGDRDSQSAYYIAESGITYEMNLINKNIMSVYNPIMQTFFSAAEGNILNLNNNITLPDGIFENSFGQKPTAVVKITGPNSFDPNSTIRQYTITSTGTINNRFRTVQKSFKITWSPNTSVKTLLNTAIFANGTIDMSGGGTINGAVGTNSSAPSSILLGGGSTINGSIFVGPDSQSNVIYNNSKNYTFTKKPVTTFIIPQFPQSFPSGKDMGILTRNGGMGIYAIDLNQDMKFTQISLDNGTAININVTGNKNLIIDKLNLTNGFIGISGTGKLTIYIKDVFTMGSGSRINAGTNGQSIGNVDQLEIYYKGATLDMAGNQRIYGSIFAENAIITFKQGASIQGHLVSLGNSISFSGGTSANLKLLYAPYANIAFSGGATINGSVIANSISTSGGSTINYGIPNIDNLSFFQGTGSGGSASVADLTPVREIN